MEHHPVRVVEEADQVEAGQRRRVGPHHEAEAGTALRDLCERVVGLAEPQLRAGARVLVPTPPPGPLPAVRSDSGVAGVLNATTPLRSLLTGLMAGERGALGARRLAGLATGSAGMVLIFAPW
ncbi:hypothetical protein ACQ5JZ_33425, partial [Streptomyces sp. ZG43]